MSVACLDWPGGQDCPRFCHFMLLSLGMTMCVTLSGTVSVQSPRDSQEGGPSSLASPPHRWPPGHAWEAESSGADGEEVEPSGAGAMGRVRGE